MDGGKSSGYFSKNMKPFFLMEGWKSCGIDIRQNSHLTFNFFCREIETEEKEKGQVQKGRQKQKEIETEKEREGSERVREIIIDTLCISEAA